MNGADLVWAGEWPLPPELAVSALAVSARTLTMILADGHRRTGEINHAQLQGLQLTMEWAQVPTPQVLPWAQLTSLTLLAPLVRRETEGVTASPGQRQTFHLHLTDAHGGADISGHSWGYLLAAHGLFLYVEQPHGGYRAQWFSAGSLGFAQVGHLAWKADGTTPHAHPVLPPGGAAKPLVIPCLFNTLPPVVTIAGLLEAMAILHTSPSPSVECIILDLGYFTPEALAQHTREAEASSYLLGNLLQAGLLSLEQSHRVLSRMAGLPEVDLDHFQVQPEASILGLTDALRYQVCALGAAPGNFFVASSTPTQQELVLLLSSLLNRHVQLVWAPAQDIDDKLAQLARRPRHLQPGAMMSTLPYEHEAVLVPKPPPPKPPPNLGALTQSRAEDNIQLLLDKAMAEVDADLHLEQSSDIIESSNFVMLVKRMIQDAQRLNVSDIHIETNPGQMSTRIRFRRDGDLEPYLELPSGLRAPLISRIKVMARLDISERRRAQDGKINFAEFGGSKLELRVAVVPTHDGLEDVVMRLMTSGKPIELEKLGFQRRDERKILTMAARSWGLILAVGPTGSGKTTTLHSILKELNTDQRKIWTAEDPIEITQEGLRQVQINPKIGVTFASAMRAFLRADPDIIMIGEIRDEETAKIAIEASLTGHLVLSTLHTNNACESVVRLLDLGMDPMNFADSLAGVVAQRLVRALCERCAVSRPMTRAAFDELVQEYIEGTSLEPELAARRLLEAAGASQPEDITVRLAVGCSHCVGKGYKGRMGVYEVLESNATLRGLIQQHAHPVEIFEASLKAGMRSLRHDALEKMVQGKIDLLQARMAYG